MNAPRLTNRLCRCRVLALLFAALCSGTAFAAAAVVKSFDLPADAAERTLQQFSTQAGVDVLFATETAAGVRTQAVAGSFTPLEAAQRMLAGTALAVTQDATSGALVVSRRTAAATPTRTALPRPADVESETGGASPAQTMEPVEVTGSRIRGLLGEATIQPTMILSSEEIERTGATSLPDALRYVPEISSYTEGLFVQSPNAFGASSGDQTAPRVTVSLRGAPAGGTLLLINGRRAPKNGQETSQSDYDLSGIPLAAIERVEVLLDGASAIYGADAVGGVINVILKRGYKRTDYKVTYENTVDTDVHALSTSLTHGFSKGKLSGTFTLNYETSGNLMWVDRNFLRTQDRRAWGGSNNPSAQIPSANGTIAVAAGNTAGVPANTLLTIPKGSTGTNKTPADFVAAGSPPAPPGTDLAIWAAYNSPYKRKSAVGSLEYDIKPWLTAFVEARVASSRTEQKATPLAISNLVVPASAPGNVFGVNVTMRRYLLDLPIHTRWSETRNSSGTFGLRGRLPHDWNFDSGISYTHTRPEFLNPLGFSASNARFTAALTDPNPANRPNLFYDATTPGLDPNQLGLLAALGAPDRSLEFGDNWTYDSKVEGPVWTIWAGDIRASVGGEYREEYVDFPLQDPPGSSTRARNRYVTGFFGEVRVPLVSEKQKIPLVNRFEINTAVRTDRYQEFKGATKPRYGALYRPFKWLLFRGTYGEGYKLPTLNQLYAPVTTNTLFFSAANPGHDIYRGNEVLPLQLSFVQGGNIKLVPEETESTTAGVVLDVPGQWFKGWSLSYNFYDYKYLNRISPSLAFADRMAIFPELFVRGPNLPTDPAGWPGPIVSFDNRAVNVATNRITGWDASMKYFRATPWGQVSANINASRAYRNENRPRPGAPPATNAVPESLPLKWSGGVNWRKGAFDLSALFSYRDVFKRSLTERLTPSAIRWDWRGGVDFAQTRWARRDAARWWGRWLADTRVNIAVFNVFDREPPMNSAGLPDSSIIDARGLRYSISVTKSFSAGPPRGKN